MDVTEFVSAFKGLLLEQRPDGRFSLVSALPRWCRELRPDVRWDRPLVIEDVFPFLSAFLPDAERAWKTKRLGSLQSDLWAESRPDGQDVYLMGLAARVRDTRVLLIVRSDALFYERQSVLQRARELRMLHSALMREIEQKDILIHAIVHDLAAPLHSIVGVLSLLEERAPREPEAGWIRIGMLAAGRQRELIAEILDIFAAESGAVGRIPPEPVALFDVVDRVVAERDPIARSRNVRLLVERSDALVGPRVVADQTRLFRVFTNLLDNAFRVSPPQGTVRISARSHGGTVTVAVEDEGPGVRPDVLPRLFEKFARSRDNPTGTGLGLFFCRISVENWGGGIGYEQRENGGARFWVRLKVASPVAQVGVERRSDGERADARR